LHQWERQQHDPWFGASKELYPWGRHRHNAWLDTPKGLHRWERHPRQRHRYDSWFGTPTQPYTQERRHHRSQFEGVMDLHQWERRQHDPWFGAPKRLYPWERHRHNANRGTPNGLHRWEKYPWQRNRYDSWLGNPKQVYPQERRHHRSQFEGVMDLHQWERRQHDPSFDAPKELYPWERHRHDSWPGTPKGLHRRERHRQPGFNTHMYSRSWKRNRYHSLLGECRSKGFPNLDSRRYNFTGTLFFSRGDVFPIQAVVRFVNQTGIDGLKNPNGIYVQGFADSGEPTDDGTFTTCVFETYYVLKCVEEVFDSNAAPDLSKFQMITMRIDPASINPETCTPSRISVTDRSFGFPDVPPAELNVQQVGAFSLELIS